MRTRDPSTTTVPTFGSCAITVPAGWSEGTFWGFASSLALGERRDRVRERLADDARHGHLGLPGRDGQRHL